MLLVDDSDSDTEVLASSPLEALQNTILFVNSDLYKTGAVQLSELNLPDVLTQLDETPFYLRGYPESDTEKLLLIAISRYIERRAWTAASGTLRASFQRLSRIKDERGTRSVYEALSETSVETHVYGVPDWIPPDDFGVITHGGHTEDFQKSWFVVFTPTEQEVMSDPDTEGPAALVAIEQGRYEWEGFWTFRPDLVSDIEEYIANNL